MNLMDISEKRWSQACLDATAPELAEKLGDLAPSTDVLVIQIDFTVKMSNFDVLTLPEA